MFSVWAKLYVNNPFASEIQLESHKIMFMVNNIKPTSTITAICISRYETNKHSIFKVYNMIESMFHKRILNKFAVYLRCGKFG